MSRTATRDKQNHDRSPEERRSDLHSDNGRSIFSIPPALKRIFDKFPLITYEANDLPITPNRARDQHVLYIFTTQELARRDAPSFNPSCLKWQTFMKLRGIPFVTAPSNNHASPSGALPFVIPRQRAQAAVSIKGLRKWITKEAADGQISEPADMRYEAYSSLLDGRIRIAWLYQLYLLPANVSVMRRLYVDPTSTNYFVRLATQSQLRDAANSEIRKMTSRTVLDTDLLREAREALAALSQLLAEKTWFFEDKATLFDASVFAYTHLLLDEGMYWKENPLGEMLREHHNLVNHRDRILREYF